ncbi:hypothetical protein LR48_Vigan635s007700 [Vigna angularis]|uniref:Uncharacterized protein n=2 Tax=Phaseolus angularis TaxID=3914 RepID=A0A0L9TFE6_PHAAN|nr:uncharacterized protein HKW66_Vig0091410 [Vigna angularis]KOM29152.1 hypothetical protein LR48_Vigan635s007700 [Vigna angularis]BAT80341.1 hypothetical protein VIGAN_02334400 [Vigna angularis var. angularis]
MEGNKSVVRLKYTRFPLEVNTKRLKYNYEGGTTGLSSEITYSLGSTLVTINVTQEIYSGSVNAVYIDLSEDSGNGSFANLSLRVTRNQRYGILCNYMNTLFGGSYDSLKEKYCAPPLPETEVVRYICGDSGCGGCFTLKKKKDYDDDEVVRMQATHDFIVGEETMHVKVKIKNDDNVGEGGLNVEVEGPMKLTTDYTNHVISSMTKKMRSAIEASTVPLVKNSPARRSPKDGGGEFDVSDVDRIASITPRQETTYVSGHRVRMNMHRMSSMS